MNKMIILIIILTNLFSALITFVCTKEVYGYSMDPNGDGGVRTGQTNSAGNERMTGKEDMYTGRAHGNTGQEDIYTGRVHDNRGKDRDVSTTRGVIDIRVDVRANTTKDLEMSPMWIE